MKIFQGYIVDFDRAKNAEGMCRAVICADSWREAHEILAKTYPQITFHKMRYNWGVTAGSRRQKLAAANHPRRLLLCLNPMNPDFGYELIE